MAEPPAKDVPPSSAPKVEGVKASKQNPALRMMGLPNFKYRLPSRNWMIFLTITGSFTGAWFYDRRQKKAVQKKWCDLVRHVGQEPLPVNNMPRKITVFLSAPPGDGISASRQYFKDYIKPVLVAAAMDYDVIEGRKEGDVRYGTAEQIRRSRKRKGEHGENSSVEDMDAAAAIDAMRDRLFITPESGPRGDLVLGRHTWKEYIRGVHEGWLGPLDEPQTPEPESIPVPEFSTESSASSTVGAVEVESLEAVSAESISAESDKISEEKKAKEEEKKQEEKKKPKPPPSYLPVQSYTTAPISPHIPSTLEPSVPLHQQHLLGFLKTPQRIYNFLNRRKLADELGRETASIVLAAHRPYQYGETFASTSSAFPDVAAPVATRAPENDATEVAQTSASYEQQNVLDTEEPKWHKSIRKPRKEDNVSEQIWIADVVLDPRIAQRMRRFVLDDEEEQRANRIFNGLEKSRAKEIQDLSTKKVKIGNLDT